MLNRYTAVIDALSAGADVRVINARVFHVTYLRQTPQERTMTGLRTTGTNPTLHDAEDHTVLCDMIAAHHDYPSASALAHMIAD